MLEKTLAWTARRSNQSILKEISPGVSLEGMMLKLKLQYFGHLMQRVDSLEKTLMLGGVGSSHFKMDFPPLLIIRARKSNQSILKDISPEYSLEGVMLKVKLQYFGQLMGRADSLEYTLMLGKIEARRRRR